MPPKCEYNFLTKAISVLTRLELDKLIDMQILDKMKDEVGKRTKILIVHDMRSICYREEFKPEGKNGELSENYKFIKMKYIYVRPGAYDYIKRVSSHPRVILSFHTFMTEENMKDVLGVIAEGREPLDFPLFSKDYCSMMDDFPNLKPLS